MTSNVGFPGRVSRRSLMVGAGACLAPQSVRVEAQEGAAVRKPRLAAVVTEYRENSHADVIVTKMLEGCRTLDLVYEPAVSIASLYIDQPKTSALGLELAAKHRVPVFQTIAEAIRLGGAAPAVDGVLLIGEHGSYPYNEIGQHLYPRKRFFDEAAAVVAAANRPIPFFNDKHLSYDFHQAQAMVDEARRLKIPLLAGSSVPVSWRKPAFQLEAGARLTSALAIGYGGTEAYGFHALEGLQCMVERRDGGETGVRSVRCLSDAAVWDAGDRGLWSWDLLRAALKTGPKPELAGASVEQIRDATRKPDAFVVEYRDGLKATVLMLYGLVTEFYFAGSLAGREAPVATQFWLQEGKPFGHFGRLCQAIERLVLEKKAPYPVERTLLTTGILDAAMHSRADGGAVRATPELNVTYRLP